MPERDWPTVPRLISTKAPPASERSYMKNNANEQEEMSFPWFELRRKLAEKLDERGIRLELASTQAEEKSPEPLAENLLDSNESS